VALLCIDLDHFKNVNDTRGHALGDELLCQVSSRLQQCVRIRDTLARLGGDEFGVILTARDSEQRAHVVANRIRETLSVPFDLKHHQVAVTASVGIALFPDDAADAAAMLNCADLALNQAKAAGRNNYQFFKSDMNAAALARRSIEQGLRQALERSEFVLHYQPQTNFATGAIAGVEALLRWQHPSRGLLCPVDFMAVAEESGLIVPMGRWVLQEACRQAQAWEDAGFAPIRMAVNVSAVELRSNGFAAGVHAILTDTGLLPRHLELELTETSLMQGFAPTVKVLQALKGFGVQLALDDFGAGYSSLTHMRSFPIDTLKIGRSFVRDLATDADDASIVSAVINMGHSLHMLVVAAGVETAEQAALLRAQACPEGQGYHFGRPGSAAGIATLRAL